MRRKKNRIDEVARLKSIIDNLERLISINGINIEWANDKINEHRATIKGLEDAKVSRAKKSVDDALKSNKNVAKVVNSAVGVLTVEYLNGELKRYGYEPTFWSAHERNGRYGVEHVKAHYKNILRVIDIKN